jgi:putative DNA primase/helicase
LSDFYREASAVDKQKARDLDDLTLALMIEDHFGSENLRKHPSGIWFFDCTIWRLMKEQTLKAIATDVLAQQIDQVRDARVKAAISLFKSRHFDEDEQFERGDHNVIVLKDGYYRFDGESWSRMTPDRDLMRRIRLPSLIR